MFRSDKNVYFIYTLFYNFESQRNYSGGIQTYIENLIKVFSKKGYLCHVIQCDDREEKLDMEWGKLHVINNPQRNPKVLCSYVEKCVDQENDIVVFADDDLIVKNKIKKTIGIQHGIAWDKPYHTNFPTWLSELWIFKKTLLSYKKIHALHQVKVEVCVDNNFINWYRALVAYPTVKLVSIPNFTAIGEYKKEIHEGVKIIFARRFVWYRGTRLFTGAIKRILDKYNVQVTVAGRGPDEQYLRENLEQYGNRVEFINFENKDSIKIHSQHDIAVVPTVGSEGTSLSLLEAMSSRCAVICTNVGGMTDIVIDEYNGLMISPDEDELFNAIERLVLDENLRASLAENAYEIAQTSFSIEKWEREWIRVIEDIEQK